MAEWLPVMLGLIVLYVPTFYDLVSLIWIRDDEFHGAIVLVVIVWLVWDRREVLLSPPTSTAPAPGIALLMFGLLLYILGRSQGILIFQVAALIPVLAGTLLAMRGWPALRALWLMLLFIAYLVPLPAYLQDSLTLPLSQTVAAIVDQHSLRRRLSDCAPGCHAHRWAVPTASRGCLRRPQFNVQPFSHRAAVPVPEALSELVTQCTNTVESPAHCLPRQYRTRGHPRAGDLQSWATRRVKVLCTDFPASLYLSSR